MNKSSDTFCNLCSIAFLSSADLNNHYTTEHDSSTSDEEGNIESNGYGCGDCSGRFSSFQELCDHMEAEHPNSVDDIQCVGSSNDNLKENCNIGEENICVGSDNENDSNALVTKEYSEKMRASEIDSVNCKLCHITLKKNADLVYHNKIHTGYVCLKCKSCFLNELLYRRHIQKPPTTCKEVSQAIIILERSDQSSLDCKLCQLKLSNSFDLHHHFKQVHGKVMDFDCSLCDKRQVKSRYHFANHIIAMHSSAKQHDKKVNTNAAEVGSKSLSPKYLEPEIESHDKICEVRIDSFKKTVSELKKAKTEKIRASTNKNRGYYCHVCQRSFKTKLNLSIHTQRHTGPVCPHCKCCFKNTEILEQHIKETPKNCTNAYRARMFLSNIDENKDCMTCNSKFNNSYDLKHHKLREHGIKPVYKCSLCDAFNHNDNVTRQNYCLHINNCHIKNNSAIMKALEEDNHIIHQSKATNYQCSTCIKDFKSSYALKQHKWLIHTKLIDCTNCNKLFNTKKSLLRHESKQFKLCLNTLKAKKFLNSLKETGLECKACKIDFINYIDFHFHNARFHGEKKHEYHCSVCNQGINEKRQFIEHICKFHIKRHTEKRKREITDVDNENISRVNCSPKVQSYIEPEDENQGNEMEKRQCKGVVTNVKERTRTINKISKSKTTNAYYCHICQHYFKTNLGLVSHTMSHTGPVCPHCKCCLTNDKQLAQHLKETPKTCTNAYRARMFLSNIDENKDCMTCNSKFNNSYDLKHHKLREHGIKPVYKCSLCDAFNLNDNVTRQNYCLHINNCHIKKKRKIEFLTETGNIDISAEKRKMKIHQH